MGRVIQIFLAKSKEREEDKNRKEISLLRNFLFSLQSI